MKHNNWQKHHAMSCHYQVVLEGHILIGTNEQFLV